MANYFRKLALLFFVAALSSAASQQLNCTFFITPFNEYACRLEQITTLDRAQNRTLVGSHLANFTNADVDVVQVYHSNTPFMIPEVFTTFPNINELDYFNTSLQRIEVPASARLVYLVLESNNITRIHAGDIQNQTNLFIFDAYSNNIQEIDDDALSGMPNVFFAVFIDNDIRQINANTFRAITDVFYLDLEGNSLTRLDAGLFASNIYLSSLYLEHNQINAISPQFVDTLPRFLGFIEFSGNQCVDRFFTLDHPDATPSLNNGLQRCFDNFNGTTSETRRLVLEFQGNLSLFDQFGNLIFRT